ncbi:hypothetical protein ACRCQJ_12590 [Pseudomonas aeruginosa]|jgi:hypothetical protein|nr:hypothetical protein [Pseudomonas aeruginosa]OZB32754.1 MAG: hypothetical protein B7X51_05900 [Pseudomonas sp. 34-62-33]MCV4065275.1 hypothetical protein [Pseudomonas aeruginosa]MCV4078780.1 hypothetical protein [Pseudomonas aeruginosa]MCV4181347.1 hypothetical protein [Pseudomonas aeruginosa]MCV4221560.1 hypothetical protein [Pseudomonas aeruginosa]
MQDTPILSIEKEADLCNLFMKEFGALPGWRCYPEAGGFDVLAVHDDGRQLGVEAKMALNAKVAEQILPGDRDEFFGKPGPDYRLVIVSKITPASAGIARMLAMLGVLVLVPNQYRSRLGDAYSFNFHNILEARGAQTSYGQQYLHDWNPAIRCHVPALLQALPAGVPSPVKLTPWKEKALTILALMRRQGFITAKQIAAHGHNVTRWTQPDGMKPAWLTKGAVRGQWIETEYMPAFDKQHPELYEVAVADLAAVAAKEFSLG